MAKDNVKRESTRGRRKRIAIDFDGVLHQYSKKWHDGTIYDEPVEDSVICVQSLARDYDLIIFTCREDVSAIYHWIEKHYELKIPVTNSKPHADMYIDDRGYHFEGSWADVMHEVGLRNGYKWDGWNHRDKGVVDTWQYSTEQR